MDTCRRSVLTAGAVGAVALVAGCGGGNGDDAPTTQSPATDGEELARTAEIPVGGGRVFKDEKVVVTQPTAGQFKAFSAVCTHQGCTVGSVSGGLIHCPCHGSKFRVADASVAAGPARSPLPPKRIVVSGDSIRLA